MKTYIEVMLWLTAFTIVLKLLAFLNWEPQPPKKWHYIFDIIINGALIAWGIWVIAK